MDSVFPITDEELREELEKMGYKNIPDDILKRFKRDLEELMVAEQLNPSSPPDSLSPALASSAPVCLNQLHKDSPVQVIGQGISEMSLMTDRSGRVQLSSKKVPQSSLTFPKGRPRSSGQRSIMNISTVSGTSSVTGSAPRIIKRKVLRQKDGESFIEEMSYVSNISSNVGDYAGQARVWKSPCPDFSQGLDRSKNLSRSTGSLSEAGQDGVRKPVRLPAVQYGVKSCDPVTRYHQYCQFWKTFKPPGEKSHKKLRWTIREQMLDYDPIVEISLKQIPNMYKVPRERPRPLSRSASLSSLAR